MFAIRRPRSCNLSSPAEPKGEKVSAKDRKRYRDEVSSLGDRLASGPRDEKTAWEVYANTEKLIAVLKLRLDYETPGVFTKLPDASDPDKLLSAAATLLSISAVKIEEGSLVEAIETMRKARNNLRSYLTPRRPKKKSEPKAGLT